MSEIIDISTGIDLSNAVNKSIDILQSGDVFIYPTDTIYGIGCDIYCDSALKKIADIKGREQLQPYIILISSFDMLNEFAALDDEKTSFLQKHWPGPLTVILNSKINLSPFIDNNISKIAVRMPDNQFCLELIAQYKKPITSTSANIHNKPQGEFNQIVSEFNEKVNLFIYSGEVKSFSPSTIIDFTDSKAKIVRKGALEIKI